MIRDSFGRQIYSENDLCDLYMQDRHRKMREVLVDSDISFDQLELTNVPNLTRYVASEETMEEFDAGQQALWFMPEKYASMDIAAWILDQCSTDDQLERVGKELLMFSERDMIPLLRYLKYLVDTMREHRILWGVGRGSSTASYVLFLIGIHRIDSMRWNLSIDEFLK